MGAFEVSWLVVVEVLAFPKFMHGYISAEFVPILEASSSTHLAPLHQGANGTLSVPAWNHRAVMERRRRELRVMGMNIDDGTFTARQRGDERRQRNRKFDGRGLIHQQVGALFQGYGTHYLDLWVGTPPQRQTVIVDTGSGVTAFPCQSCIDCGESYHTDHYFDPQLSETFERLDCDSCYRGQCASAGTLVGMDSDRICRVNMRYQEGSSWTAYEATDISYAGGPHDLALQQGTALGEKRDETNSPSPPGVRENEAEGVDPQDADRFAFRVAFGCQFSLTGLFRTQLADGILGMDNAGHSFWKQMYNANVIDQQKFSLCFSRQDYAERKGTRAGAVTLGGVDTNFHLSPLVWTKNVRRTGFFTVRLKSIYLRENGGESARPDDPDYNGGFSQTIHKIDITSSLLNTGGVIVDSGTTDTYMTYHLASPFQNVFEKITGQKLHHDAVALTEEQLLKLPTILLVLEGTDDNIPHVGSSKTAALTANAGLEEKYNEDPKDVVVAIPATHYMEYDADSGLYTARFNLEEASGSVLGANTMQGHDVVFDIPKGAIGWAESPCDYVALINGEDQAPILRYSNTPKGGLDDGTMMNRTCQSPSCRFGVVLGIMSIMLLAIMSWRRVRRAKSKKQYDSALPTELDFEQNIEDDAVMTLGRNKPESQIDPVTDASATHKFTIDDDDDDGTLGEVSLQLKDIA